MSRSAYFEPLKRSYRNWLRKRNRILPTDLPPPFFYTKDINAVHEYFSGFKDRQADRQLQFSSGLHGNCYLCKQEVDFVVDVPTQGGPVNWRERITCPKCNLINRWRSCLHVFEELCKPTADDRIYLTETFSPVFENLDGRFPSLSSSEYFPDHEPGEVAQTHVMPVINEDVTNLSFDDSDLEMVLCFDVLEHVPDYHMALKEFYRVLNNGGQLVLSVPFSFQQETSVRARIDKTGNIEHLVEPCYHGDPLSDQGVLSYYDFGMELLDELHEAGFQECFLLCFCSEKWGYLDENVVFIARKLKSSMNKMTIAKLAWQRTIDQIRFIGERLGEFFRYAIRSIQKFMGRLSRFHSYGFNQKTRSILRLMSRIFRLPASGSKQTTQSSDNPVTDMTSVLELPEIFHYWSSKYISSDMSRFGFSSPEEFLFQHTRVFLKQSTKQRINILSLGSGDCSFEYNLAKKLLQCRLSNFVIECLDINSDRLNSGKEAVDKAGLAEHFQFTCEDVNSWKPYKKYGVALAYYSLHDVQNLEGLFDSVEHSLKPDGLFIISDLIGRNGQMRWPEALDALKPFWDELPEAYRYNRVMGRQEKQFINHDRSIGEGLGLRTQDILPLLLERFNFNFFYPYGNIIFAFIDRSFGHNFDVNAEWDKDFVDRVHARDEAGILSGELKPTSMLAVLTRQKTEVLLKHPDLTPGHCLRKSSVQDGPTPPGVV